MPRHSAQHAAVTESLGCFVVSGAPLLPGIVVVDQRRQFGFTKWYCSGPVSIARGWVRGLDEWIARYARPT